MERLLRTGWLSAAGGRVSKACRGRSGIPAAACNLQSHEMRHCASRCSANRDEHDAARPVAACGHNEWTRPSKFQTVDQYRIEDYAVSAESYEHPPVALCETF